ncbi:MAG TPA: TorF family putative porin [Burkholderiaceae bacterium]
MNFPNITLVAALALVTVPAFAQTAAPPPPPPPPWTLTGNAGLFSDYTFRGISQTNTKPAFQGGFDVGHESGFYAGNWNSNVDAAMYNGANLEMDFYGGFKATFGDFGLDVGGIYYYYPGSGAASSVKIDNGEIYVGGSWGPLTAKYFYAVTDFFGAPNSDGSAYLDLGFSYDLGSGFGLVAHVGYQRLKGGAIAAEISGSAPDSITDYKLGGTYTVNGFVLGAAFVGTNRDYSFGTASSSGKNVSDNTFVVSVSKSF